MMLFIEYLCDMKNAKLHEYEIDYTGTEVKGSLST